MCAKDHDRTFVCAKDHDCTTMCANDYDRTFICVKDIMCLTRHGIIICLVKYVYDMAPMTKRNTNSIMFFSDEHQQG